MSRSLLFSMALFAALLVPSAPVLHAQTTDSSSTQTEQTREERRRMRAENGDRTARTERPERTAQRERGSDPDRDPERVADRENRQAVREAIEALPEDQREAFMERMRALQEERRQFLEDWQTRYDALIGELPNVTPQQRDAGAETPRQERTRSERRRVDQ